MTRHPLIRDFLTGVFALGAVVGMCAMLILFGEMAEVGVSYYTFRVTVTNSGGLAATSPVTLNGVKVGQVSATEVRPAPAVGAEITVKVKEGVEIPRTAAVSVERGLVGDSSLEFTIPADTTPAQFADAIKEDEVFDGGSPMSMFDRVAAAVEKPLERLTATAENIDKLAATYNTVGERLAEMLEPRTPADVDAGKAPNLRSTLTRLDSALSGADRWLNDPQIRDQATSALKRANETLEEAARIAQAWTKTAKTVQAAADKAGTQLDAVGAQAVTMLKRVDAAAGQLAVVLEATNKGEGTLGQLVKNPDLYNSLKSAADRLDRALVEFKLLVEKFKAEGIPLRL